VAARRGEGRSGSRSSGSTPQDWRRAKSRAAGRKRSVSTPWKASQLDPWTERRGARTHSRPQSHVLEPLVVEHARRRRRRAERQVAATVQGPLQAPHDGREPREAKEGRVPAQRCSSERVRRARGRDRGSARTWRGLCGTRRGAACAGSSTGWPGSFCRARSSASSAQARRAIERKGATHCAQSQIGSTNMTRSASNSRSLRMKRGRRKLSPRPRYTPSSGMPASAEEGAASAGLVARRRRSGLARTFRRDDLGAGVRRLRARLDLVSCRTTLRRAWREGRTNGVEGPRTSASCPSACRCSSSMAKVRVTPSTFGRKFSVTMAMRSERDERAFSRESRSRPEGRGADEEEGPAAAAASAGMASWRVDVNRRSRGRESSRAARESCCSE